MVDPVKAALRAELRAKRDGFVLALSPGERNAHEARIAAQIAALAPDATCIAVYIAVGTETSCAPLIDTATQAGIAIALPRVTTRSEPMRFLRWRPGDPLESGWRGLQQPHADAPEILPDVIVTPLLGFDAQRWRIGQGAGFYDGAFAAMPHARRIGIGWAVQQVAQIPRDPWDVRLHAIVTEWGMIEGSDDR